MHYSDKLKVIDEITERLMLNSKIKNPELAREIARKWVTAK